MGKTYRKDFWDKPIPEYQNEKIFKGDEKGWKHMGIKRHSDKKNRYAQLTHINKYDLN